MTTPRTTATVPAIHQDGNISAGGRRGDAHIGTRKDCRRTASTAPQSNPHRPHRLRRRFRPTAFIHHASPLPHRRRQRVPAWWINDYSLERLIVNLKKWSEDAPLAVGAGIAGAVVVFLLGSISDFWALKDRAEERSKLPKAHISELDPQYRDKIVLTLMLSNPTSSSTSFSDFMLNVQRCDSNVIATHPTYAIVSQGKTLPPSPVNIRSKEKAATTLAFLVLPDGTAASNSGSVCRVSIAWFDENNERHETKPLVFNAPVAHYRAGGAAP